MGLELTAALIGWFYRWAHRGFVVFRVGEEENNIGMELIIDPAVLFLDEPTTGLDASTANCRPNAAQSVRLYKTCNIPHLNHKKGHVHLNTVKVY